MKYSVISADGHIDIPWLPADLFVSQAPNKLKEHMPQVVETKEGKQWVADGKHLAWVGGAGLMGAWEPYVPGISRHLDRMEEESKIFSAGQKGIFYPGTPELRAKHQDLDGVEAEVIYGILGLGGSVAGFFDESLEAARSDSPGPAYALSDPEIIITVYDIYNEWVAGFCRSNPRRFAALACIASHDPKVGANQLYRAAEMGLPGAELNLASAVKPIYHKDWDVLWAAATECNMSISFHISGVPFRQPDDSDRDEYRWVTTSIGLTLGQLAGAEFLSSMIWSGACERYPNFKFVLGECGIAWIPFLLDRMDEEYKSGRFPVRLSLKPSEYWRRQGYSTFQTERLTPEIVSRVGENNIMWGSDYPHPDTVFPDSRTVIENDLVQLDEGVRRRIVCENAAKLYRFK